MNDPPVTDPLLRFADWEAPEPPTDLIFDDGEPLESNRHRIAMNVLIDSMLQAWPERTDFFAGGNMFVYYSRHQVMNRDFRGPDFFVVVGVEGDRERQGWVVWEEEGRYPDVIVELMSPSTARTDKTTKKDLYEQTFHTLDYYVYDPFEPTSLQGWHLNDRRRYAPIVPSDRGWLWCETLGLWLGLWDGQLRRKPATGTCHWLRFFDPAGNLILLQEEVAAQAIADAAVAAAKASEAEAKANEAEAKANEAQVKASEAEAKAAQIEARNRALADQLRSLGIDPDAVS